jgi:N-acetylglutamate synthase-like GNAT family acetyltransferase
MIYESSSPLLIPRLLEMAKSIPDMPISELEKMLVGSISSHTAKIFVEEKEDEIRGFVFCSNEVFDGKDACFIQVCAIKPLNENIGYELLHKVKMWAKDNKLEFMYFITKRNPKAFEKKYKFDYHGTVLRKKVED